MTEAINTAPALDLNPQAMDHLVDEWRAYHALYSRCFSATSSANGPRNWSAPKL